MAYLDHAATTPVRPEAREAMETLNGIHSNAAGFRRWLDTRGGHGHAHPHGPGGHTH